MTFHYHRSSDVWANFDPQDLAEVWEKEYREICRTLPLAPYASFLQNDWCRHCIWPWLQGWRGFGRLPQKSRYPIKQMYFKWSVRPKYLLRVGGAYARDPTFFPQCQQTTTWVYANLRPLEIQPSKELLQLRRSSTFRKGRPWNVPDCKEYDERTGQLPDEVCSVKLLQHMESDGLLITFFQPPCGQSIWYGHDLPRPWFQGMGNPLSVRNPITALDHPESQRIADMCWDRTFHLPSAERLDQMPTASGNLPVEALLQSMRHTRQDFPCLPLSDDDEDCDGCR
jgi:hypothetical protein